MQLVLDIETDSTQSKIWMVVTKNLDNGEVVCHWTAETLKPLIESADTIIGHNLISFDAYHLEQLWQTTIPLEKCWDTLIVSRLLRPDIADGHSLEAWGRRLNSPKLDYKEWDNPDLVLMEQYCRQDVELTAKLYVELKRQLKHQKFSDYSVWLEHQVASIIAQQVRNGVLIDEPALMSLLAEVTDELTVLTEQMVKEFEPTVIQLKTKVKTIPFNPGSRMQIIDRLKARGWKPTEMTEKGNVILDEEILKELTATIPEAKTFLRMFELQKIQSFLKNWTEKLGPDGRIHGNVITNGAVTGRMTHSSPNLGQVPSAATELGKRCRALFIVPKGYSMVGVDASGLELRMLAHYMQDDDYVVTVCEGKQEDKTDVHSVNQRAAGLATRAQAKTFIYAYLYSAGDEKIGQIVGGNSAVGRKIKEAFLAKTPALAKLREKVKKFAEKGSLPGLDGRRLYVRSPHKALNTLLQGGGAAVMKVALVVFDQELRSLGIPYRFLLNVHDEVQVETPTKYAEQVAKLGVEAIKQAGVVLKLRCPLDGEAKIGANWRQTH